MLFCVDNFGVGGTELNAVRTAEALADKVSLAVASLQPDGPLRARYGSAGIPLDSFPVANLYGARAVAMGFKFARLVRKWRPDVIHCHDIYSNIFFGFWGRIGGVRSVVASRRWGVESSAPRLDRLNTWAMRGASRVVVNSSDSARSLVHELGLAEVRVRLIPNFIEEGAFETPGVDVVSTFRSEIGVESDATVLGMLARLSPVKEHSLALEALARLLHAGHKVHLVLMGEGPSRAIIERQAQELAISNRVTLMGRVPNRPNPLGLVDIALLTSRSEGFPNAIVEAMAAGKPVVATDVGGVRDAVEDKVTGRIVPIGNVDAVTDALACLSEDSALRMKMGEAGRRLARERFGEDAVMARLLSVYQELGA